MSDADSQPGTFVIEGVRDYGIQQIAMHDDEGRPILTPNGQKVMADEVRYLLRWKGYGPEDDSWEPIENFDTCNDPYQVYESWKVTFDALMRADPQKYRHPVELHLIAKARNMIKLKKNERDIKEAASKSAAARKPVASSSKRATNEEQPKKRGPGRPPKKRQRSTAPVMEKSNSLQMNSSLARKKRASLNSQSATLDDIDTASLPRDVQRLIEWDSPPVDEKGRRVPKDNESLYSMHDEKTHERERRKRRGSRKTDTPETEAGRSNTREPVGALTTNVRDADSMMVDAPEASTSAVIKTEPPKQSNLATDQTAPLPTAVSATVVDAESAHAEDVDMTDAPVVDKSSALASKDVVRASQSPVTPHSPTLPLAIKTAPSGLQNQPADPVGPALSAPSIAPSAQVVEQTHQPTTNQPSESLAPSLTTKPIAATRPLYTTQANVLQKQTGSVAAPKIHARPTANGRTTVSPQPKMQPSESKGLSNGAANKAAVTTVKGQVSCASNKGSSLPQPAGPAQSDNSASPGQARVGAWQASNISGLKDIRIRRMSDMPTTSQQASANAPAAPPAPEPQVLDPRKRPSTVQTKLPVPSAAPNNPVILATAPSGQPNSSSAAIGAVQKEQA